MLLQMLVGVLLGRAYSKLTDPKDWCDYAGATGLLVAFILLGSLVTLEGLNSAIR